MQQQFAIYLNMSVMQHTELTWNTRKFFPVKGQFQIAFFVSETSWKSIYLNNDYQVAFIWVNSHFLEYHSKGFINDYLLFKVLLQNSWKNYILTFDTKISNLNYAGQNNERPALNQIPQKL